MDNYLEKLKHILPTFLAVTLGTIFGTALVRWGLSIQLELIDIKLEIWEIWLPLILPWLPMTFWLRQKLRILTFKGDNDYGRLFFQFIGWGTMTSAMIISQTYLTKATGDLVTLKRPSEIEQVDKARYYRIAEFDVLPMYGTSFTDFRASGKYNQHLNFNTYFACPIVDDSSSLPNSLPKYWYGVSFKEQISNKISTAEKEKRYDDFYQECLKKMNSYKYHEFEYLERLTNSEARDGFYNSIKTRISDESQTEFIILQPQHEPLNKRAGNKVAWTFGSFSIGLSIFLFSLIWPGYSKSEHRRQLQGKSKTEDDIVEMLKFLIPKGEHFATSVILDINILVFILMTIFGVHILYPNSLELLEWGANRRRETMGGDWWRLFSSMFVHGGFMHLILNIYGLWLAAIFVEPILGRKKYFILYGVSGVCGSIASIWWYENTISVGASGAIFGLYGAILGLLLTNAFPKEGKRGILTMIGVYVVINLLWGLTGGIDNAAHIGGLLSGTLTGLILYQIDNE